MYNVTKTYRVFLGDDMISYMAILFLICVVFAMIIYKTVKSLQKQISHLNNCVDVLQFNLKLYKTECEARSQAIVKVLGDRSR